MEQEKKQELIFKLGMFEQQIHQLQEQIDAVERGINDLGSLGFGLDELKGSIGKEILSPLGRGVFVKTTLASEDLTVDIGGKNFVRKGISETKEIIEEQIKKLIAVKSELNDSLEKIGEDMKKALEEFQNNQ
ncbi:MAG: prefoldin subunit alpha [Nanoarchaeota archaeon]|nr:prefoldin subunit alpha [Nanoarchaeota archaeon]